MIYTVFKNKKTNEEIIILEGNDDKDMICSIVEWEKLDVDHKHYGDDNYRADWDDEELKLFGRHGNYIKTYKILSRLPNGKNIYKL